MLENFTVGQDGYGIPIPWLEKKIFSLLNPLSIIAFSEGLGLLKTADQSLAWFQMGTSYREELQ